MRHSVTMPTILIDPPLLLSVRAGGFAGSFRESPDLRFALSDHLPGWAYPDGWVSRVREAALEECISFESVDASDMADLQSRLRHELADNEIASIAIARRQGYRLSSDCPVLLRHGRQALGSGSVVPGQAIRVAIGCKV